MAWLQKELSKALWLLHSELRSRVKLKLPWVIATLTVMVLVGVLLVRHHVSAPQLSVENDHIAAGTPKEGMSYFFSLGDFGVAACEKAYKAGDLEDAGGIGHWGCGAQNQKLVADVMDKLAATLKPKFILSLGDNFYIRGVKNLEDPQFKESFVDVYRRGHLEELPWQVSLGDHDHRGNISAMLLWQNDKWQLPSPYYSFQFPVGPKHLEFLITDSVGLEGGMLDEAPEGRRFEEDLTDQFAGLEAGKRQWEWIEKHSASYGESPNAVLQVVVGHRPIRSLASRGPGPSATPPEQAAAQKLKESLAMKGKPVVFLHGHDHVMQHFLEKDKPLYHFGNGVGGMGLHPFKQCSNCTEFKWVESAYGFAVHEVGDLSMNVHFVDINQKVRHSVEVPFSAL